MEVHHMDRSIGELFSDLSQQTADLIRQEVRLAKAELSTKFADVGKHAAMIAAAAVAGLTAVIALAATIALVLVKLGVTPWLAAGITAVVFGAAAFLLAQQGLYALRQKSIAPVETINSLKETTQWLKNATR
jgi:hypothetical protein